jgi:hypothetical protein
MPLGIGIVAAFDFADAPPVEFRGIAILLIAGDNAAFAADALRHVEVETVLFAGAGLPLRDGARRGCSARAIYAGRGVEQRAFQ